MTSPTRDKRHCAHRNRPTMVVEATPETITYPKISSKGCTEFHTVVPESKIPKEPAGDVRFCVAPQNFHRNFDKLNVCMMFLQISERVQMLPNASKRI